MAVWGSGLYSGDFAMDLRGTFRSVTRLPFDGEKLLQILCDLERTAANNPADEEHTTFWLVVADQFAKHGIPCLRAQQKALQIIDSKTDITILTKLGMDSAGLRKRQKMLTTLRQFLMAASQPAKRRSVIKNPQPLLLDVGDVFVYPTSLGRCKQNCPRGIHVVPAWEQDGWNAAAIVSAGRAFDFLAWYRPLTLASPVSERPDLAQLRSASVWVLKGAGTARTIDLKRLGVEKIGTVPVDSEKLKRAFPGLHSGAGAAISNRSIERELTVGSCLGETFISERALQRTPDGLTKLSDLIKEATERYAKLRAFREKANSLPAQREPTISNLHEILV